MSKEKPEKTQIPSDPNEGEFGMDSVKDVPKFKPYKVEKDITNNSYTIE